MLFKDLDIIKPILKALEDSGYEKPTEIQKKSIPVVLKGKDILGCAQTGTGKTAAFAIPILQNIAADKEKDNNRSIKALIVAPTRELAIQIEESFAAYSKYLDIKDTVIFINSHDIQGLKIHSTYIVKNTVLANMYYNKEYEPITLDYYLDALTYVITHVRPDLIIHRISGDAPKDLLVAPEWNLHKKWILNGFENRLKNENLWQGKFYKA